MRTRFEVRGTVNDIQHVGISRVTHTSGIDNILSVQVDSDKNHISVGQNNHPNRRLRYVFGYTFLRKSVTSINVGKSTFRVQVYKLHIFSIF